jgi:hypothetical protein
MSQKELKKLDKELIELEHKQERNRDLIELFYTINLRAKIEERLIRYCYLTIEQ